MHDPQTDNADREKHSSKNLECPVKKKGPHEHSIHADPLKKSLAACYSPAGDSRSTLAAGVLNFRVRNGDGCDSTAMATRQK
jgi:hypothetical protein